MTASDGKTPVEIELTVECGLLEDGNDSAKSKGSKTRYRDTTLILTTTSDLDFLDFRRISYVYSFLMFIFVLRLLS